MKQLGSIYSKDTNLQEVVNDLIVTFNTQRKLGQSIEYRDMHLQRVTNTYYGILIFEYETAPQETAVHEKKLPKFFNMPEGTDPQDPATWGHR